MTRLVFLVAGWVTTTLLLSWLLRPPPPPPPPPHFWFTTRKKMTRISRSVRSGPYSLVLFEKWDESEEGTLFFLLLPRPAPLCWLIPFGSKSRDNNEARKKTDKTGSSRRLNCSHNIWTILQKWKHQTRSKRNRLKLYKVIRSCSGRWFFDSSIHNYMCIIEA